jgi:hypothetical protein
MGKQHWRAGRLNAQEEQLTFAWQEVPASPRTSISVKPSLFKVLLAPLQTLPSNPGFPFSAGSNHAYLYGTIPARAGQHPQLGATPRAVLLQSSLKKPDATVCTQQSREPA